MSVSYDDYSEEELVSALKTSARKYFFMASQYDPIDSCEYLLDILTEMTEGLSDEEVAFNDYYAGSFDNQIDPAHFLRAVHALVTRQRKGPLANPELKKAITSIRLLMDFEEAAGDQERDVIALFARRMLEALDQPVPGKLRRFLGSLGLAPQ